MVLGTFTQFAKRVPLIKFRKGGAFGIAAGKATGKAEATATGKAPSASKAPASPTAQQEPELKYSPSAIDDNQLPSRYQRKPIDFDEIECINSGGCQST